jgi:hypothetical protein
MLLAATPPPRLPTLILLSALAVASLNMFLPSLAHIAAEFGAGYGLVNLSIAGRSLIGATVHFGGVVRRGVIDGCFVELAPLATGRIPDGYRRSIKRSRLDPLQ